MASYIDNNGDRQEVDLQGTLYYKLAADAKLSVRQYINRLCPTRAQDSDAFSQMCINSGLRFKADDAHGIPAANLRDLFNADVSVQAAVSNQTGGTFTGTYATPDSLRLFPAALLEAIEDSLSVNRSDAVKAFDGLIGYRKTIVSNRYDRPYISYGGKSGPEDSQFQRIAQNSRPPLMLSITASQTTKTVPTSSIGMEISQEALAETSLDLVALTLTRFMQVADYNEWTAQMLAILSGDSDGVTTPTATEGSALSSVTAQSYDALVTTAGSLTQKAWLKYLYNNSMTSRKTHIVTDFDGAYALDGRTDRPTNVQNNSVDRMDIPFKVTYPNFGDTVDIVVMPADAGWTANTLMGLDSAYALAKITSSSIAYAAAEDIIMKKSREIRIDRGFSIFRLYDDAFDVMTLTVA